MGGIPNVTSSYFNDLVAVYNFNDGTRNDSFNNFNLVSTKGNSTNTSGIYFSGRQYNYSVSPTVGDRDNNSEIGINDIFTISVWIKPSRMHPTTAGGIVTDDENSPHTNSYSIRREDNGDYSFFLAGTQIKIFSVNIVEDNSTWYNLVAKYDGTDMALWLDGVEKNTTAKVYSTDQHGIALGHFATGVDLFFNGTIDEVYVWNRSLNSSEIIGLNSTFLSIHFPTNASVYLSDTLIFNHTGEFNFRKEINVNITKVNDIILGDCTCTNCSIDGANCLTPITFFSETSGVMEVNLSNATYAYGLDNCSDSFNIPNKANTINFSFVDEENGSVQFADFQSKFNFTINGSTHNQFELDLDQKKNFSMCIYPAWGVFTTDYTVIYEGNNYPSRRFNKVADSLTSALQNINLQMLKSSEGIFARFKTVDQFENVLVGVIGEMRNTGETAIVESELTDSSGIATFFVDPNKDYDFTFTKTGFATQQFTLRPTTSEIFNVIMISGVTSELNSTAQGESFQFFPLNSPVQNNTVINFSFEYSNGAFDILTCTMNLQNSSDNTVVGTNTSVFNTTNCKVEIHFNTGNHTGLRGIATVGLDSSTENTSTFARTWLVQHTYQGEFSLQTFLDDISSFTGAGFNDNTRLIIAFILIFALTGLAIKFAGLVNPEAIVILVMMLTLLFSFIGWLTIPDPNISTNFANSGFNVQQYMIFILMLLSGSGYIIWRHQT